VPTSVGDIQSFLGLAGYYRRFMEGFSNIRRSHFFIYCDASGQGL
jgi:hypothetical protein